MRRFALAVWLCTVAVAGLPGEAMGQNTSPQQPQAGTFLIQGGTVVVRPGERIEDASVLIQDGRIAAVGREVSVPADAVVIDATGRFVYPGMIDSRTPLGLYEIASIRATVDMQEQGDFNPQLRTISSVNPHSELIPVTRANGVTTAAVIPMGGVITGQASLIRLEGWTWEEMALRAPAAVVLQYPRSVRSPFATPTPEQERAGRERVERQERELRDYLRQAREYARIRAGGDGRIDPGLEALRPVLAGEVPLLALADSREQIEGSIALADSFGLRLIISGAEEAWKVSELLARRNIPVILGSLLSTPAPDAPYDALWAQPAVLHRAGVRFAFSSGEAANARHLPYHAALAVAYGLPADAAWRALTVTPAEIWGVAEQLGTLEVGRSADLFIATGDPLDVRTRVEQVFIAGRRIPQDDRHTRLYERFRARPASP